MIFTVGDVGHVDEHNRQLSVEMVPTAALKAHRISPLTFAAPDVWVPVEFEAVPAGEQLDGVALDVDNITIVSAVDDLFWVSGWVRPLWGGSPATTAVVASRIVNSQDGGTTWVENRCLQAIQSRERRTGEVGTFHYMGTVDCQPGTLFRLEVRVSDIDLSLTGSDVFDNPVSVSIQAHGVGRLANEPSGS